MNFMQMFPQFMMQHKGEDPNQMLQQMLSSGQINQNQLNQAQQMMKRLEGPLGQFKPMFGFK